MASDDVSPAFVTERASLRRELAALTGTDMLQRSEV
jgi:hypothetical protein